MPASIGVNLRVTGHCSQGGRKYMEDLFSVAYQQTEDERDLEYAFFGIYDGHGGSEAAAFAKEHLMDSIVKQRQFWSDNDEDVLKAIRNGYMLTHMNMWKELEKWPKTVTGLPSTAGTTASIAFIRRGKIYIGHVGDSAIILGYQKDGSEDWAAKPLTLDHKPESTTEMERIARCGGKVISKAGVPRVVWNRPRPGHKGPIKKNTPMDEIPFLAVARSLGDLWSYNTHNDEFVVSPDPDVGVLNIDPAKFRCLIFGTDGLWNMISPEGAVSLVQATERHNEAALVGGTQPKDWLNPSKSLVDHALERWSNTRMRADNTSVVTLMLDPPGPPRATVLRSRCPAAARPPPTPVPAAPEPVKSGAAPALPQNGLTIMTRYSDDKPPTPAEDVSPLPPCSTLDARYSLGVRDASPAPLPDDADAISNYGNPAESYFMARLLSRSRVVNTLSDVFDEIVRPPLPHTELPAESALPERDAESAPEQGPGGDDGGIQINEVSSSSPAEGLSKRGRKPRPDGKPASGNDRVLRSHDADPALRPQTRQTRQRPPPPPALERVVILSRRAPPAPPDSKPEERTDENRRTRSQHATPLAQKISRGLGAVARELRAAGNSTGAATAVARRDCASRPRRTEPRPDDEVHSTTPPLPPPPPALGLRALRSRNETELPRAGKRARLGSEGAAPHKAPKLCGERLQRRAAGPWAPALALRNRLRKRLAK